ncbi:hypothetical protein HWC08_gp174 [Lactobacillus phage 521B]|uniref:Uncharacterized protein n=1 Tax=Lactobacillus phage 521B TaxID=2510942 RepID=A0A4Y5FG82_9CAUD|nr:hypothetical protein HWC08_gp174 [Lactobacillus phage 521B]QBJ03467.1 hypothetical protein B521_0117 [Lactobacillus phage 521B]
MEQLNKDLYFNPDKWNPGVADFTNKDIEDILTQAGYSFVRKDN